MDETIDFLGSTGLYHNIMLIMIPVISVVFLLQISEKMGQGVLMDLFTGKYHHPKEQNRIFMFLDMKSSTAIAERLGHSRFYDLLNQFFADMTDPILKNRGEIYQYVGDEVVISWTLPNGIGNTRCLNCYFDILKVIQEKKPLYEKKFGLVPEFKAGMHFGLVTTGEVGVIKREITHSGDVLNTAARIQSLCNSLGSPFIISRPLLNALSVNGQYSTSDLGEISLKGKEEKVGLVAVSLIP